VIPVLRRLLYAAMCAGLLSGVVAMAAHQLGTVPLLLQAEQYEHAAGHAAAAAPAHQHAAPAEWAPEDGIERAAYTLAADLLTGIGFALLLAAGIALRGTEVTWREGLLWGLAGFVTFVVAPGLGLPPDIPGNEAGPLLERQLWWAATAAATGGGLALLAFTRRPLYAVLGAAVILLPHLYGAPLPAADAAAATPAELAHRFAVAVTLASFVFWAALGAATGYFYRLFAPRDAEAPSLSPA
jgi:cobalt transporter subunit CbtA